MKYTQETPKANSQQLTKNRKITPKPKESPKQPTKEPSQTRGKPKDPRDNPQPTKAHNPTTCGPFLYYT
jgi:hypothetical protein